MKFFCRNRATVIANRASAARGAIDAISDTEIIRHAIRVRAIEPVRLITPIAAIHAFARLFFIEKFINYFFSKFSLSAQKMHFSIFCTNMH